MLSYPRCWAPQSSALIIPCSTPYIVICTSKRFDKQFNSSTPSTASVLRRAGSFAVFLDPIVLIFTYDGMIQAVVPADWSKNSNPVQSMDGAKACWNSTPPPPFSIVSLLVHIWLPFKKDDSSNCSCLIEHVLLMLQHFLKLHFTPYLYLYSFIPDCKLALPKLSTDYKSYIDRYLHGYRKLKWCKCKIYTWVCF